MNLFQTAEIFPKTILSKDGIARYFGPVLSETESNFFFHQLIHSVPWENDEAFLFGKHHVLNRKMALFSKKSLTYTYSGSKKKAHPWTPILTQLEVLVLSHVEVEFNTCLINFYPTGSDKMGYHADDEKEIIPHSTIASISLGPNRFFDFKHNYTAEKVRILLENGSLLTMENEIQLYWKHQLPIMKKVVHPRINLTFRNLY